MAGIGDSFLPQCGNVRPSGVVPYVLPSRLPSHTKAIYLAYDSLLIPNTTHFPPALSTKIASLDTVEDGLQESALGASWTPSCHSPPGSGAQSCTSRHPHSREFVPFAASGSSRCIPGGEPARGPNRPLESRPEFETLTRNKDMHVRTLEFSPASGVVWSQPEAFVTEGRGVFSFSSLPRVE